MSENAQYMAIMFFHCNYLGDRPTIECFTEEQTLEYVQRFKPQINILTATNFVDFDDINQPVQQ